MSGNFQPAISIIIIGHNTKPSLIKLLHSINQQKTPTNIIETIYVDDGSSDDSFESFEKYNLSFKKKSIKLKKNCGRVVATQKGINIAEGVWFLFVRSNVVLDPLLLSEYLRSIESNNAIALVGRIKYTSSDFSFTQYLNGPYRGVNKYKHNQCIHYKNLLFGNCIIHSDVFKKLSLNRSLRFYGGEELDLSEKIFINFRRKILACSKATVCRENHPGLIEHSNRLIAFGQLNFRHLSKNNQKTILSVFYYLKNFSFLSSIWNFLIFLSHSQYEGRTLNINYYLIRMGMLSSIMKGLTKLK